MIFTHLGITLARALGIPARAVSAYALQLDPPDFHAIFEVYLENGLVAHRPHAAGADRGDRPDRKRPRRLRYRFSDDRQAMPSHQPEYSGLNGALTRRRARERL